MHFRLRALDPRRQPHPEHAALAELALDLDPAAVALHDRLGDAEAETHALDRALLGLAGPEEPVEQPVPVRGRDPDAAVDHTELDPVGVEAQGHLDEPAGK